jgi:endonuclease/exonuclease/phosphatase family metal-dependent hydrolase
MSDMTCAQVPESGCCMTKPYHIDYAFASADLVGRCELDVGKSIDWLHLSDHMPLVVTVLPPT